MLYSTPVLGHKIITNSVNGIDHPVFELKKIEGKKEDSVLWSKYFKNRGNMEDAWSGMVSLTALSPQIFSVWVLQGTVSTLSNCDTSSLIFVYSFIAPLWT